MATSIARHRADSFRVHQDAPSTEDAEHVNEAAREDDDAAADEEEAMTEEYGDSQDEAQDEVGSHDSHDDHVESDVQSDMEKLQNSTPAFRQKYRLLKRIGEGTFSTVYKAEDLLYDHYDNGWDVDKEDEKWTPPPLKRRTSRSTRVALAATSHGQGQYEYQRPRQPKYVAIKKIYVTSSPSRILNELELLHDLADCPAVCPLITAFRSTDQVMAVLPYFGHADFREYFRKMTPTDMAIYLRVLFTALAAVHERGIIHRDIKPTNFLYDPLTRRGVLVDFGLAEREGVESRPCLCHEDATVRRDRLRAALASSSIPHNAYPKQDVRPSRRANRAGTRGFRAPEVLFKCTEQTTKIDVWSAGVILLTILSKRFPFFNSADDVEALVEIATIFGIRRMKHASRLHGCDLDITIPTIGKEGFSLERIVLWSTCRLDVDGESLTGAEKDACEFMNRCLDLDPCRRISAKAALEHPFLQMGVQESIKNHGEMGGDEDEMDMLQVGEMGDKS